MLMLFNKYIVSLPINTKLMFSDVPDYIWDEFILLYDSFFYHQYNNGMKTKLIQYENGFMKVDYKNPYKHITK